MKYIGWFSCGSTSAVACKDEAIRKMEIMRFYDFILKGEE